MTDEEQIDGVTYAEKEANGDIVVKPDAVSTEKGDITRTEIGHDVSREVLASDYTDAGGSGTYADRWQNGPQEAINDLDSQVGDLPKRVIIDGVFRQNLTIDTQRGLRLTSFQPHAQLYYGGSGSNVVSISTDDVDLTDFWIDGGGNSGVTCVNHTDRELTMKNMYLENAETGFNAQGAEEMRFWGGHGQNITGAFVDISDTAKVQLSNLESDGYVIINGTSERSTLSNIIVDDNPSGAAFTFNGNSRLVGSSLFSFLSAGNGFTIADSSIIQGLSRGASGNGVEFTGDRGVFFGGAFGSGGQDLQFTGASNCIAYGRFESITFDSNSTDCRVYGSPWAMVTNNGTNCSVV